MASKFSGGVALALLAAFGFSAKAIFIKLAYGYAQAAPVGAVTLLALRMAFALPVFLWIGLRESRNATTAPASSISSACSTSAPAWSG